MKKTKLLALLLGFALILPGCGFTEGADAVVTVIEATPTPTPEPTPEVTPTPEPTPTPAPVIEQTPSGVNVTVGEATYYTTADVNVRSDCNAEAEFVTSAVTGTALTSTGVCENGWIRVVIDGQTGYVSGDYVTTTAPEGAADATAAGEAAAQ